MSQEDTPTTVHPDALELARLLRPSWPAISAGLHASGVPCCEGEDGDGDGDTDGDGETAGTEGGQETFPREVVEKLRKENAAARKRAQEAEARAKEFEDRDKTEQEKKDEAAKQAADRAAAAETKLLRYEVAADKGVPTKLAKFLTGSTKEDIEQAADELLAEIGQRGQHTSFDGGARETRTGASALTTSDMDAAIRRAAGR